LAARLGDSVDPTGDIRGLGDWSRKWSRRCRN